MYYLCGAGARWRQIWGEGTASPIRRRRAGRVISYTLGATAYGGRERTGVRSSRHRGGLVARCPSSKQPYVYLIPSVFNTPLGANFLRDFSSRPTGLLRHRCHGRQLLNSSCQIPEAALATSQPPRVTSEFWSPKTASLDPGGRRARQGQRSLENGRLQLESGFSRYISRPSTK